LLLPLANNLEYVDCWQIWACLCICPQRCLSPFGDAGPPSSTWFVRPHHECTPQTTSRLVQPFLHRVQHADTHRPRNVGDTEFTINIRYNQRNKFCFDQSLSTMNYTYSNAVYQLGIECLFKQELLFRTSNSKILNTLTLTNITA